MKLHIVSPSTGLDWVRQGMQTLAAFPGPLLVVLFLYLLVSIALSLIPYLGFVFVSLITPALTAGQLEAARSAGEGRAPAPTMLFAPMRRTKAELRPILLLGVWYLAAAVVIAIAAEYLGAWLAAGGRIDRTQAILGFALLLYAPLLGLVWFASGLAHWYAVPPGQGLFYALIACWRNKGACLVYAASWVLLATLLAGMCLLLAWATFPLVGALLWMLVASVLAAGISTSTYFAFRDCFIPSTTQGASPAASGDPS